MCIGLPLQVQSARPGRAVVAGRGQRVEIDTALVGDCEPGQWLLVFLGSARERLDAERAAEINATLDLIDAPGPADLEPPFPLPSSLARDDVVRLTVTAASNA